MVCAFTGHRPQRLAWGDDESDPRCVALKVRMAQEIARLQAAGADTFLCGMALGCDQYFAEAVLDARQAGPASLWAVLPYGGQSARWTLPERTRHGILCDAADRVIELEDRYSDGCMLRRNRFMVDQAQWLMTVYDGGPGGTGATVRYAKQRGVALIALWL